MYITMIIFKKVPEVLNYFQNKANFQHCHLSALFDDQDQYYAVIASQQDSSRDLIKLKSELNETILVDNIVLTHGDERDVIDNDQLEYTLRVFPIISFENIKEFYIHITPDIAAYFLEANKLYTDYDLISAATKQLFVFTKKVAGALPANDTEGRQRFPQFYARLDQLINEEIGKSKTLGFQWVHDNTNRHLSAIPLNHSTLFSNQPSTTIVKTNNLLTPNVKKF